jgi:hypothetical protein
LIAYWGAITAEQRRRAAEQLVAVRAAFAGGQISKIDFFNRSVRLSRAVHQRAVAVFFENGAPQLP